MHTSPVRRIVEIEGTPSFLIRYQTKRRICDCDRLGSTDLRALLVVGCVQPTLDNKELHCSGEWRRQRDQCLGGDPGFEGLSESAAMATRQERSKVIEAFTKRTHCTLMGLLR